MYDVVQIVGSLLILAAFIASMSGRLSGSGYPYLLANAVGSMILAATAIAGTEWGFVLLEGVWAVVSCWSILHKLTGRGSPAVQH